MGFAIGCSHVASMVLLVSFYKKDSQPLRAAFFSFCFIAEVVGGECREQPCVHSTASEINPDNGKSMGDASETVFEEVGGDAA